MPMPQPGPTKKAKSDFNRGVKQDPAKKAVGNVQQAGRNYEKPWQVPK